MRLRYVFPIVVLCVVCAWAPRAWAQTAGYRGPQMPECRPRTALLPFDVPERVISIEPKLRAAVAARPEAVEPLLDLARCYLLSWERNHLDESGTLLRQASTLLAAAPAAETPVATPGEPVRVTGGVPARISGGAPAYPPAAQMAGIMGLVFIDAVIDTTGAVRDARVVGSIPELDAAAQAAVRGWKYAPPVVDGRPAEVIKLVSVRFASHAGLNVIDLIDLARFHAATGRIGDARAALDQAIQAVADRRATLAKPIDDAPSAVTPPVLIKHVDAIYPPVARMAKIQGYVVIEIIVTEDGDVVVPTLVKPAMELLNHTAGEAVAQWRYSPAQLNGKAVPVRLNVKLNFSL